MNTNYQQSQQNLLFTYWSIRKMAMAKTFAKCTILIVGVKKHNVGDT